MPHPHHCITGLDNMVKFEPVWNLPDCLCALTVQSAINPCLAKSKCPSISEMSIWMKLKKNVLEKNCTLSDMTSGI